MVTDRTRYGPAGDPSTVERLGEDVRRAAQAGVDLIQVRERGLDDRALLRLTLRLATVVAGTAARILVNGRTDVALAARASGVHLPTASPGAARVRHIVPSGFVIGRSVHDLDEAVTADRQGGCDYLVFGAVYPTRSKPSGHRPAGVEALERVCAAVRLPVLAIGGIAPDRFAEVAAAGAAGIAAIGLFVGPPVAAPGGSGDDLRDHVARLHELFARPPQAI
jgi:thiamine-phosphate pyrophosphorylase